jgi:hypothetical protein
MRPVRAAAARNIKNAAAGSIYHHKMYSVPFTSKDSDDYSKSIIQSDPISCSTSKSHLLSIEVKTFGSKLSNCQNLKRSF